MLGLTLDELAAQSPVVADLNGEWFAAWQTSRSGVAVIDRHQLKVVHLGLSMSVDADGDYHWRGDLRITGGSILGTYQAVAKGERSFGVMYFNLGADGSHASGRWTGSYFDGPMGSGWGAWARTPERATELLQGKVDTESPSTQGD